MDAPPTADEAATDPAGWYCFSLQPRLAEWDGVAWTGSTHATGSGPLLPGPPAPFAFVRQTWFRWMVIGQALVILPAILSGSSGQALWSWLSVVGYAAFLGGSVQLVGRVLHLDALDGRRSLTWIGIGSGVAAFIVGVGLEILADRGLGWAATLWLTGPIEEGGKLLVPFLLLVFGARRFKVPRVGLYLVLISGATVGVLEGAEYEARPDFPWAHLQMALLRPSAELLHVFVTGFAAAVIWLAAWRKGRAATGAGAVAFLIAMAIHSFHDGIITFFNVDPKSFNSTLAQTLHEALAKGLSGGLFALGLAALFYLLARHGARELTSPGDVATCPPPWRPQIKLWGCDQALVRASKEPLAWSPYGAPGGYGGYGAPGGYGGYGAPVGYGGYGPPDIYGAGTGHGVPGYGVPGYPPAPDYRTAAPYPHPPGSPGGMDPTVVPLSPTAPGTTSLPLLAPAPAPVAAGAPVSAAGPSTLPGRIPEFSAPDVPAAAVPTPPSPPSPSSLPNHAAGGLPGLDGFAGLGVTPPSASPLAPPPPVATSAPVAAPPGWYRVGGDPGLQAWWTGTAWSRFHRWNGYWWEPA